MALNTPAGTFSPVSVSENPRAWKSDIGLMNASTTNVVFTIESLIGFLKTHQIEVDSNYNEFKNLPKYASFGKLEPSQSTQAASNAPGTYIVHTSTNTASSSRARAPFRSTRSNIKYGNLAGVKQATEATKAQSDARDVQVLSGQNPKESLSVRDDSLVNVQPGPTSSSVSSRPADVFIPTRKVREVPGGGTLTIGNLFGGDDEPVQSRRVVSGGSSVLPENSPSAIQGFIPSRKVREPPGGVSQISAIFG